MIVQNTYKNIMLLLTYTTEFSWQLSQYCFGNIGQIYVVVFLLTFTYFNGRSAYHGIACGIPRPLLSRYFNIG